MGTEAIGYVLGQQCAPVIAGIKPSNLLIVEKGNQKGLEHVLKGTGICKYLLHTSEEKDYWFLFEPGELEMLLAQPEKAAYLKESGYDTQNMELVLMRLAVRFSSYKQGWDEFPHEMGVLFGYPLGDVKGFIENGGKNFKISGYWKVYDDVVSARRTFKLYAYAKQTVLELCGQGVRIPDIYRSLRAAGA